MSGLAPNVDSLSWARVSRRLAEAINIPVVGAAAMLRASIYGDLSVQTLWGKPLGVSAEGSYFVTRSPTVDTGLATIAALATFAPTSPFVIVTNGNPPGGPDVHLDFIKLVCSNAGTGGTNLRYATKIDPALRYLSGGVGGANTNVAGLAGPYPSNTGSPSKSGALVYAGALVALADSSQAKVLESGPIRSTINVINDSVIWTFGDVEKVQSDLAIATATAIFKTIPHGPVSIAPGHSYLHHIYAASQSAAASWEVTIGHVER